MRAAQPDAIALLQTEAEVPRTGGSELGVAAPSQGGAARPKSSTAGAASSLVAQMGGGASAVSREIMLTGRGPVTVASASSTEGAITVEELRREGRCHPELVRGPPER